MLALPVLAAIVALQPFLAAGAVLGFLLVWVTVNWPLAVVGVMLALGPLDLSFLTGGLKGLLPQLGGLDMNGIRLVGLTGALALVVLSERGMLAALAQPTGRWYAAFLAFVSVTLFWAFDPIEGTRLLFKLIYPLLVFLVLSAPGRTSAELRRVADWILLTAVVILLLNPFFVAAGGYEFDFEGRLRVGGAGLHQNPFSFYLLVIILMSFGRFLERGERRYLALAAMAAFWVGLTLTRITLAAAVVGLGGIALYGMVVYRSSRIALGAALAVTALAVTLGPSTIERTFGYLPGPGDVFSLLADPVGLFNTLNWSGREQFWPVLVAAWASSPWWGLGLGTSTVIMVTGFPPEAGGAAHNEYLRLGVETGFIGLGLYLCAAGSWLAATLRAGRTMRRGIREFALPGLAAILAWAVLAITDNALDYLFTQFVAFLVAGAIVVSRADDPAGDAAAPASLVPSEDVAYVPARG